MGVSCPGDGLAQAGFDDTMKNLSRIYSPGTGISTDGSQDVVEGMKAVLPSFRLLGPTLENHHARYGIQHMQVCPAPGLAQIIL